MFFLSYDEKHIQKMTNFKVKFSITKKPWYKCSSSSLHVTPCYITHENIMKFVLVILHWKQAISYDNKELSYPKSYQGMEHREGL